jgi:scyllo-inositol 2-dehydrogenase (NADP+)
MRKIQTAIVGFGLSGKAFHAPFIHVHQGFDLKQVVERHRSESKKIYPDVQVVRSLEEVLQNPEIDLVVVASPNTVHFDHVKRCLEAGKHVVVDKPFMNTTLECDAIIQLSWKLGKKVFVYQNRRWDGDFLTIQKIIKSGVLGDLQYFEAHFDRYNPHRTRAAWRDEDLPGSGLLYDLGPHLIDQALQLFGTPLDLSADIRKEREGSQVDDYFRLSFEYDGLSVVLTAGMLVEDHELRYILHGSNGSYIKYGLDPQEALLRKGEMPGGKDWGKEDPEFNGLITIDDESEDIDGVIETLPGNYMAFYDNVYSVLTQGAEQAVRPEEARAVIHMIEKAFESQAKHEIHPEMRN